MEGKHTKGPWFVTPDGFRVTDKPVWFDQNGSRHGETPNIVIFAETQANARLIAAAPDMLEALQVVEALHKRYCDRVGAQDQWARDVQNKARAAIAKATGQ